MQVLCDKGLHYRVSRDNILPSAHKCPRYKNTMKKETTYYVLRKQAVPEVLQKVVEAKKLLESGRCATTSEAADKLGISRSSFYKYKDDIYEFHDGMQGTSFTMNFQMDDEPGLLSKVLGIIARKGANILTIHQSLPLNGVASLSITVQMLEGTAKIPQMVTALEKTQGIHKIAILGKT